LRDLPDAEQLVDAGLARASGGPGL
jgi:hypothetical protein